MTVKAQSRFVPNILSNQQYSGMGATLLYNWPIFVGGGLFSVVFLLVGAATPSPLHWFFWLSGGAVLFLLLSILTASYIIYDWGDGREYSRLAEIGQLDQANILVDITCGKLRGTRGVLSHFKGGHYFLLDLFNPKTMTDQALLRARSMEPPLMTQQRIYRRAGQTDRLPIPHNWADAVLCHLSLHEFQQAEEQQAVLKECVRLLKSDGKLLVAEHGRDWRSLLAFGPGVFSFFPQEAWEKQFEQAGLQISHHELWRGFVHLWVLQKKVK